MTAVKICGITRQDDAEAAAAFGADFVGFVLWPQSPRATTVARIREIIPSLPDSVVPVGVFVDPAEQDIRDAANAGIRLAQVHGRAPAALRDISIPIVRAVHLSAAGIEPDIPDDLVLLDAHDPVSIGGTGKTIDWARASRVARARRVILAGGLTPLNVRDAVAIVQPFAVDVASGVESRPGIKDHALVQAFIRAAKETM